MIIPAPRVPLPETEIYYYISFRTRSPVLANGRFDDELNLLYTNKYYALMSMENPQKHPHVAALPYIYIPVNCEVQPTSA